MPDMKWPDAISKVLQDAGKPLHYAEITKGIIESGYRKSVGATPAATVSATLSMSLKNEGDASPFFKPARGVYGLRAATPVKPSVEETLKDQLFMGRGWRYYTAVIDIDLDTMPVVRRPTTTRPASLPLPGAPVRGAR